MRALVLVTARELRAYAPAWMAIALAALLPWAAPLLPNMAHQPAAEVRTATAFALAGLMGAVLAVFTGAGLLARDLAEGRIAFFLALPLRTGTLWAGRLLAAALLVYLGIAAVALPALIHGLGPSPQSRAALEVMGVPTTAASMAWLGAALAPFLLMLLVHQLAVALRTRSAWLMLDVAGLAIAGALLAAATRRLLAAGASTELSRGGAVAGTVGMGALVLAGGWGLRRGGALLGRVHRSQAAVAISGSLLAAILLTGFTSWVLRVGAADVEMVHAAAAAPRGNWVLLLPGLRQRPSYTPWMLFDSAAGCAFPLTPGFREWADVTQGPPLAFSDDGARALSLQGQGSSRGPREVLRVDLGARAVATPTGVTVRSAEATALVLLPDRRFAVAEAGQLAIWSDDGRALEAAGKLPSQGVQWQRARPAAGGVELLRLRNEDGTLRYERWLLAPRAPLRLLAQRTVAAEEAAFASVSADGSRLLLTAVTHGMGPVRLLRASDGSDLAALTAADPRGYVTARFLADGRIVAVWGRHDVVRLVLFDADGVPVRAVALGAGRWGRIGPEWRPGVLPILVEGGRSSRRSPLLLVDADRGSARALGEELAPVDQALPFHEGGQPLAVGAPASHLFLEGRTGALIRLNEDGARRRLLPLP